MVYLAGKTHEIGCENYSTGAEIISNVGVAATHIYITRSKLKCNLMRKANLSLIS
jgi:hypothetical protein